MVSYEKEYKESMNKDEVFNRGSKHLFDSALSAVVSEKRRSVQIDAESMDECLREDGDGEDESNRLFGRSTQLPANKTRRSIFERMEFSDFSANRGDGYGGSAGFVGPIRNRRRMGIIIKNREDFLMHYSPYKLSSSYNNLFAYRSAMADGTPKNNSVLANFPVNKRSVFLKDAAATSKGALAVKEQEEEKWLHDKYEGDISDCSKSKIFVRNLPRSITNEQLNRLFSRIDQVSSVKIEDGALKTACVGFVHRGMAEKAVQEMNGKIVLGSKIKISVLNESSRNENTSINEDEHFLDSQILNQYYSQKNINRRKSSMKGSDRYLSFLPNTQTRTSIFDRMT